LIDRVCHCDGDFLPTSDRNFGGITMPKSSVFKRCGNWLTVLSGCALTIGVVLLQPALAEAGSNIRKDGSIVAEIDGRYLRQRGSIVAEFDGDNVRRSGSIVLTFDGRYVRERGSIIAEIDGRNIRRKGSIEWQIDGNGNVRRHGSISYSVDGYTDSESMKRKIVTFLLLFAE
jgi:hypothetical protein